MKHLRISWGTRAMKEPGLTPALCHPDHTMLFPAEGLHHRKAAGIFKDGTSHIPVGLCLHRGVLCAVPGDEQQKPQ